MLLAIIQTPAMYVAGYNSFCERNFVPYEMKSVYKTEHTPLHGDRTVELETVGRTTLSPLSGISALFGLHQDLESKHRSLPVFLRLWWAVWRRCGHFPLETWRWDVRTLWTLSHFWAPPRHPPTPWQPHMQWSESTMNIKCVFNFIKPHLHSTHTSCTLHPQTQTLVHPLGIEILYEAQLTPWPAGCAGVLGIQCSWKKQQETVHKQTPALNRC